jgi:hypothetical protein
MESEFGMLVFDDQLCAVLSSSPEDALERTNKRIYQRFQYLIKLD